MHLRMQGRLECRVHGIPYPKVTFKHDWRIVADSHRVKIVREDHDHWTLNVANAIRLDEGMYECVVENVAGKVYCTAAVKVTGKWAEWWVWEALERWAVGGEVVTEHYVN